MRTKLAAWGVSCVMLSWLGACDAAPDPAPAIADRVSEEPAPGVPCFGSKECVPEEYCATPEGECGREGVCTPVPAECPRTREPVCTCDALEFLNGCHAAQAKQNVDFSGTCPPPACTSNKECDPAAYCATATGACDSAGACTPRPEKCSGLWQPVCGCDGLTYANACKAAQVGVPILHDGAC